jgi:phosphatidylglycerol:prolipoprotein diacylglycerol transferase
MLPADFPIDMYPIMMIVGIVISFVYMEIYFHKLNIKKGIATFIEIQVTISALFGVLFAILFQNLYDYIESPSSYSWSWGMTFYGGIIGGVGSFFILYFSYFKKKYSSTVLKALEIVAPAGITVAHGIGRIGCLLDGCCYGLPTDSPLGIKFSTTATKVWPTNLFECLFLLIFSVVLLFLALKKNSRLCFPLYMLGYGAWRFGIEYLRGDDRGSFIPGLTPSQFWSVLLFIAGIGLLIYVLKTPDKKLAVEKFPHNS